MILYIAVFGRAATQGSRPAPSRFLDSDALARPALEHLVPFLFFPGCRPRGRVTFLTSVELSAEFTQVISLAPVTYRFRVPRFGIGGS